MDLYERNIENCHFICSIRFETSNKGARVMNDKNKIIDIRTVARPIKCKDQSDIIAERRRKRKERHDEIKRKLGRK
jgi:hypothetical protein